MPVNAEAKEKRTPGMGADSPGGPRAEVPGSGNPHSLYVSLAPRRNRGEPLGRKAEGWAWEKRVSHRLQWAGLDTGWMRKNCREADKFQALFTF